MSRKELEALSPEALRNELARREHEERRPRRTGIDHTEAAPSGPLASSSPRDLVDVLLKKQRSIYGVDDRKDHGQIADQAVLRNCDSVAALFDKDSLSFANGVAKLSTASLGARMRLCSSERFRDQPCGAFCSGFVVGRDLIATAGHCFLDENAADPARVYAVFGFRVDENNVAAVEIPESDVYRVREIVDKRYTEAGTDWAIVRVERLIDLDRHPMVAFRADRVSVQERLYVIGHPSGLPVKYAPGARVTDASPSAFFRANLDTFGGNSGSPVFDEGHQLAGILVRGATDYVWQGECRVAAVFPTTGQQGEDCTHTTEFVGHLPQE